ncbi:MAG TPA: carboxymuconolactone decarboxylase family protein [Streptosporangiaceae bacterium]
MKSAIMANGLKRSLAQIRYVTPVMPGAASGVVASVYTQAEHDFGMVAPPVALHSPAPSALAGSWAMLRETLLVTDQVDRVEKEMVAAGVSVANACPYCVSVHSAAAQGVDSSLDAAGIAAGNLPSPRLQEIFEWARSSGQRGSILPPPAGNFAELAGVAVTFQYLNRMVTVFLPESPLPPMTPKAIGGWVMGMLASAMTSGNAAAGVSLELLPDAKLPEEFSWAAGDPRIASALAGAAAAVEEAAAQVVTPAVRELVTSRLSTWDGKPQGASRAWADQAVAALTEADRPAGLLALLTAFAPYQVGKADVAAFRSTAKSGDEAVIALTAWASMAAARTAGSWLREQAPA